MKIAIVADPFVEVPPKKYGGTELVIYNLITGLMELGHDVTLLAPGDSSVPCKLIPTTEKALGFAYAKSDTYKHELKTKKVIKKTEALLKQLIKKNEIDIIHSHANIDSGFDIRKFTDVPTVTTMHGPVLFHQIEYYKDREDLNFITISKNQQEAFPGLSYVGVAYNGENPSEFPIVDRPEDYICFLGRFDREKNPHLAILLAIALDIPIKIAGKKDHLSEGYFEEEIEPYIGHPLVEYLGELDFEQKVQLLANAKCNIHPTGFREPFGLTVIEAAYCGTPTLAINRGAMPELIEENRTGVLVEDLIEGYYRLEECFTMDRKYIAKRSRSLFNYRNMAEQYVDAYMVAMERHERLSLRERVLQGLKPYKKLQLESLWDTLTVQPVKSTDKHQPKTF
jgi:glycosyltransferase involved in cell wall biosynthesis